MFKLVWQLEHCFVCQAPGRVALTPGRWSLGDGPLRVGLDRSDEIVVELVATFGLILNTTLIRQ